MRIPFDRPFTRRWLARVVSALPAFLVALPALVFVALLFGLILRQQWDQQLELTEVWFVENVGSLEPGSYRREEIPDEINLAGAVEAITADPFLLSEDYRRAVDVGQRFFSVGHEVTEQEPLVQEDFDALEAIVERQTPLSRAIDALEGFTRTRLEGRSAAGDSQLRALHAARFRSAEIASLVHKGECERAGAKTGALERIAAVFGAEAHVVSALIGTAIEKLFYQVTQQIAEAELFGRCRTQVDWQSLEAAALRHAEVKASYAEAIAAEGSLVSTWTDLHRDQLTFMDRLLGDNAGGVLAETLRAYGELAIEVSAVEGSVPAAPVAPLPARWLEKSVMAMTVIPILRDGALKQAEALTARKLTRYAMQQARCAQVVGCVATAIPLPLAEPDRIAPLVTFENEVATVTFLAADADQWAVSRTYGTLSLRLPAQYYLPGESTEVK